jgi:hypothetical protein
VRRKLSIACLLFAWFCANGALWDAVQVVAWAKMFSTNITYLSFGQALARTFDGSKPCEICTIAQHGKDETNRHPSPATLGSGLEKILLVTETATPLVLNAPASTWPGVADDIGRMRTEAVPVPPPRV